MEGYIQNMVREYMEYEDYIQQNQDIDNLTTFWEVNISIIIDFLTSTDQNEFLFGEIYKKFVEKGMKI